MTVAEGIRRAIADLLIVHTHGSGGHVTISIGVAAALPGFDDPAAALVKEADEALHEAKRSGRNGVVAGTASAQLTLLPTIARWQV